MSAKKKEKGRGQQRRDDLRQIAREKRDEGMSLKQIADFMGLSKTQVHRYVTDDTPAGHGGSILSIEQHRYLKALATGADEDEARAAIAGEQKVKRGLLRRYTQDPDFRRGVDRIMRAKGEMTDFDYALRWAELIHAVKPVVVSYQGKVTDIIWAPDNACRRESFKMWHELGERDAEGKRTQGEQRFRPIQMTPERRALVEKHITGRPLPAVIELGEEGGESPREEIRDDSPSTDSTHESV
jgi:AcrR family transcriptional regulator